MEDAQTTAPRASRSRTLLALFAATLALRPQIVAIGPLAPLIHADLHASHSLIGLLSTIPVLCMGVFALPASWISGRLGSRLAIAACLVAVAAFGLARALAPGIAGLVALTVAIGVALGVAGPLLPVAVKEDLPAEPAFATGVYVTGLGAGAAAASAFVVPVAHALGGWRSALVVVSALTAVTAVVWLHATRTRPRHVRFRIGPLRSLRLDLVWRIVAAQGLNGAVYYGLAAWLPDAYVEHGWSAAAAGTLASIVSLVGIPSALLLSWIADRRSSRQSYLLAGSSAMLLALLGVLLAPGAGYLWAVTLGVSNFIVFVVLLTLPLDVGDNPREVALLGAVTFAGGYLLAGLAPLALGAARDLSGTFVVPMALLAAGAAAMILISLPLTPTRVAGGRAARRAAGPSSRGFV